MEYNAETCLVDMLYKQLEFQQVVLARRKQLVPSDVKSTTQSKVYEACYHAACMIVELHELSEAYLYDIEECNDNLSEDTKIELIDAWIFFLNQLLFSNILPTKALTYYFNNTKTLSELNCDNIDQKVVFEALIGKIIISNGKFIHNLRFKKWKEYAELDDNIFALSMLIDDVIIQFAQLFKFFGLNEKDVWQYFCEKLDENIARQQIGGKYEN